MLANLKRQRNRNRQTDIQPNRNRQIDIKPNHNRQTNIKPTRNRQTDIKPNFKGQITAKTTTAVKIKIKPYQSQPDEFTRKPINRIEKIKNVTRVMIVMMISGSRSPFDF